MSDHDLVETALAEIFEALTAALPAPLRDKLATELRTLKELLMEARPPKLMIVGRRGAGKSSLVNAIFGEKVAAVGSVMAETAIPSWYGYRTAQGELRILDTRGLGEREREPAAISTAAATPATPTVAAVLPPRSSAPSARSALDEIEAALAAESPDALLFLCKAKEADARIAEDIENVAAIRRMVKRRYGYDLPVVGVVTQVDEMDPKRVEPPYAEATKQHNIAIAVSAVTAALAERGLALARVIPTSAYAEYQGGEKVYDNYWNIDLLVDYLVEGLPQTAQLQLARLSRRRTVQERLARRLTGAAATLCAGVGAVPIPIADIVPITGLQIGLITAIAYVSGREMSTAAAREFLVALGANVGVAFALREAARALAKVVFPGGGLVISSGVAFAGTWGVGEAAIAYFIHGRTIADARRLLRKRRGESRDGAPITAGEPGEEE